MKQLLAKVWSGYHSVEDSEIFSGDTHHLKRYALGSYTYSSP